MNHLNKTNIFIFSSTLVYIIVQSFDLLNTWKNDPLISYGTWTFVLWLVSLVFSTRFLACRVHISPPLLIVAIVLTTLGTLGDLNILLHLALAFGLCSIPLTSSSRVVFLLTSTLWMPMSGWLSHNYLSTNIDILRIPLLMISLLASLPFIYARENISISHRI